MARGDSTIKVSIIGDATGLTKALNKADTATGGLLKTGAAVGGGLLALGAVRETFQFVGDSLDNADRFADALDRIAGTTSPAFAQHISDISGSMSDIGLSAPEVAELAAVFADFATAAKVTQPAIEKITPDILTIASAIAATTGKTVDEVIGDIGRAAGGNQKAVSDLGVVVDKSLNPDARILDILDQLNTKFPDAKKAADDFAGAQSELDAKFQTFSTHVGEAAEGPLNDLLTFINDEIDAIPHAIEGWKLLGAAVENFGRTALGPLGNVRDALEGILSLLGQSGAGLTGRPFDEKDIVKAGLNHNERNGINRLTGP